MPYEYYAIVTEITDGDTVVVDIDLGFDIWLRGKSLRLQNVDTPECRTKDKTEKQFGQAAKAYLESHLKSCNFKVLVTTTLEKDDKYGRILGVLKANCNAKSINDYILADGYGVPYDGKDKEELLACHLANRKRLVNEGKVTLIS